MYGVLFLMLNLLGGGNPPNNIQQKVMNIDSLFTANLKRLEAIGNDSVEVNLKDKDLINFMWMISLIGNKDFISDPHQIIHINKEKVLEIEQWYIDNKQYISPQNIEKAYNIMYPPAFVFDSYELWTKWMEEQYDGLEIKRE